MNEEDRKNQLQSFGFILRDEKFFKKSQDIVNSFMKKPEPEPEEVEEEEEFLDA